jgi:hypothetical protein
MPRVEVAGDICLRPRPTQGCRADDDGDNDNDDDDDDDGGGGGGGGDDTVLYAL